MSNMKPQHHIQKNNNAREEKHNRMSHTLVLSREGLFGPRLARGQRAAGPAPRCASATLSLLLASLRRSGDSAMGKSLRALGTETRVAMSLVHSSIHQSRNERRTPPEGQAAGRTRGPRGEPGAGPAFPGAVFGFQEPIRLGFVTSRLICQR